MPVAVNGFDGSKQLKHSDCILDEGMSRLVVGIRWAKNHQFTKELLTFPLPELTNSVLCPIKAIKNIRKLIKYTNEDHLFQLPEGGSFTYRRFQDFLREILKKVGIPDAHLYSSHSFRRGGCTFSFLSGVPLPMIKLLGSWQSDAYLTYLEFPAETRSAAFEMIKMRLLATEHHLPRSDNQ